MKSEFYGTEIFLDNEATREYLDICRSALSRPEPAYYEEHMVIPDTYWRFLPWAVKGKLKEAMPDDKKVYCKLSPEEHFRCHELLPLMFGSDTRDEKKKAGNAMTLFRVLSESHKGKYKTPETYGAAQKERNGGKDWSGLPEVMKYHPERFEADGTFRRV